MHAHPGPHLSRPQDENFRPGRPPAASTTSSLTPNYLRRGHRRSNDQLAQQVFGLVDPLDSRKDVAADVPAETQRQRSLSDSRPPRLPAPAHGVSTLMKSSMVQGTAVIAFFGCCFRSVKCFVRRTAAVRRLAVLDHGIHPLFSDLFHHVLENVNTPLFLVIDRSQSPGPIFVCKSLAACSARIGRTGEAPIDANDSRRSSRRLERR